MRVPNQTELPAATPEQLLDLLGGQLAARRSYRSHSARKRTMTLVFGLLFIVLLAAGALLVLDKMLIDLREQGSPHAVRTTPSIDNFEKKTTPAYRLLTLSRSNG